MTRDVRDAALLLQAIAGHDPHDSTSANVEVPDYLARLDEGVSGLRVGVVTELTDERIDAGVREVTGRIAEGFEAAGAEVGEVNLPHAYYALEAYYIIAPAEVSSNLARFDGVRYGLRVPADGVHEMYRRTREAGFGAEAKRRIMLGTYALSSGYYDAYYAQAQKVRTKLVEDFRAAFHRYDVLLSPTAPSVAFELGAKTDDPLAMYLQDICAAREPRGDTSHKRPRRSLRRAPRGHPAHGRPLHRAHAAKGGPRRRGGRGLPLRAQALAPCDA